MQKKTMLLISFALAAILVVGQTGFAAESDPGNGGMMNGNGMGDMMKMMQNENMGKMMDAMNTPEGEAMMESCSTFLESYGEKDQQEADVENSSLESDSSA
jgi:hypothetical protein